jgi:hypothetical protein
VGSAQCRIDLSKVTTGQRPLYEGLRMPAA